MLGGMRALRQQLLDSLRVFGGIYENQSLRRLQYAWIGSSVGTWAYTIALLVYAYRQGGANAVGFVGLIRWLPAAVAAPFGGLLGDRFRRLLVMKVSDLVPPAADRLPVRGADARLRSVRRPRRGRRHRAARSRHVRCRLPQLGTRDRRTDRRHRRRRARRGPAPRAHVRGRTGPLGNSDPDRR